MALIGAQIRKPNETGTSVAQKTDITRSEDA
jgi:hypothetical protein